MSFSVSRLSSILSGSIAALFFLVGNVAAVPSTLHYQGYLTNNLGEAVNCSDPITCIEPINLTFKLYSAELDVTPDWGELHNEVTVIDGYFHVVLGGSVEVEDALANSPLWLGIQVNQLPEMTPRQQITAAPYAVRAKQAENADESENAQQLSGVDGALFVQSSNIADLCVTDGELATILETSGYGDEDVEDYLNDSGYNSGPHFSTQFSDLNGVPAGLNDGDDDTLSNLNCAEGQIARWDDVIEEWECAFASPSAEDLNCTDCVDDSNISGGAAVPIGTVIDWFRPNATIPVPTGYQICDGALISNTNSPWIGFNVPDLVNKFVRGVGDAANIGNSGGSASHTHNTDINHNHASATSGSSGDHNHTVNPPNFDSSNVTSSSTGSHTHAVDPPNHNIASVTSNSESNHSHSVNPPNYNVSSVTSSADSHNHRWSYITAAETWLSFNSSGTSTTMMDWNNGLGDEGDGIFVVGVVGASSGTRSYYTDNDNHSHTTNTDHDHGSFTSGTGSSHAHTTNVDHNHGSFTSDSGGTHTHSTNVDHNHASFTSGTSSTHNHPVNLPALGATTKTGTSSSSLPPYVGLLKLMRIY